LNISKLGYLLLWPVFAVLLGSCATSVPLHVPVSKTLSWPAPPQEARIGYVRSFSRPEDLGIRKGFFQMLGDFILGNDETRLVRPMAITVTRNHVIYVADPGVRGVHRFDLEERSYHIIRREDDGIFPSPVALFNGTKQDIYIVDSQLAKIFHYSDGDDYASPVQLDGELKQPTALAIDAASGNFYVVDTALHHIKVFDQHGEQVKIIGHRGNAPGEFNFPTHIWINKQRKLFITDSLNFRIQVLDTEGKFIRSFGKHGDGSGNMSRPKGVTTDSNGHVYVVDALFNALQIFNEKGDLLLPVGQLGQAPGEFWLPTGIFIDDYGDIYIADSHNRRVQVFRYLGKST